MTRRGLALLAAVLAGPVLAQEPLLNDPMRPPASLSAPTPGTALPERASDPQLQSILVSQRANGRRIAVIDGKMVREGQRVGNTVIETIRPTEVVIRRGSVRTTLKLFRQAKQVAGDQP